MRNHTAIVASGAVALGALLAGGRFNPGPTHPRTAAWYARLDKSELTPPGPVFGLAWTVLDGLLWFSGYRLLRAPKGTARRRASIAWVLTALGIPSYCWAFFGRRRADAGLGASAGMLGAAVGLAATAAPVDRPATYATLPLIGWLLFATFLQEEVWRRN
ncbi:MAG: tryptophan-rich sensory protein [Pseudomonadota bacterium]|nr:tryptophan-rich sensory protein [Pseudomonadota bacterium]